MDSVFDNSIQKDLGQYSDGQCGMSSPYFTVIDYSWFD